MVGSPHTRKTTPSQTPPPITEARNPEPPTEGKQRTHKGLGEPLRLQPLHNRELKTWISTRTPRSKIPPRNPLCRSVHHRHTQGSSPGGAPSPVQIENCNTPLYTYSQDTGPDYTSAHIEAAQDTHRIAVAAATMNEAETAAETANTEAKAITTTAT